MAASRRTLLAAAGAALLAAAALTLLVRGGRAAPVRNLDTPHRAIVCLGDSLTAGVGAGPGEDFPALLARALGRPVVNAGVRGDTTAGARRRFAADVLTHRPGIVVVCLGANDFMRGATAADAEANLAAIARTAQAAGAMVVLGGFTFPSLAEDWGAMYERVARAEGCLLVPRLLAGILSDPALKSDEVHPNAKGYAILAERLAGPIAALVRRAGWGP